MASPHHPPPWYCYGCSYRTTACGSCSPPPAAPHDPLLYALAAQLRSRGPEQYLFQNYDLRQQSPQQVVPQRRHSGEQEVPPRTNGRLLQSLLRRVADLESSLPDLSSSSSTFASKAPHRPPPSSRITASLRDSAARVIQAEFRRYLVRRSQVLRALRQLSSIRSRLATLKSSTLHAVDHPRSLCREATHLLLQLDCVQNEDSMVCEGKVSISKEIAGIVEALERISVQRRSTRPFQVSSPSPSAAKADSTLPKHGQGVVVSCDASSGTISEFGRSEEEEEEEEEEEVVEEDDAEASHCYRSPDGGKSGLDPPLPVKMERWDK